jgi:hypothetical protein
MSVSAKSALLEVHPIGNLVTCSAMNCISYCCSKGIDKQNKSRIIVVQREGVNKTTNPFYCCSKGRSIQDKTRLIVVQRAGVNKTKLVLLFKGQEYIK